MRRPHPHSIRWAVPAAAFAAIVALATVPGLVSSAGASVPNLPPLTPAELLAKAQTARVEAFSGTVTLRNDLGIPDLSGLGGGSSGSLTSLLAGTHEARVAVSGADHVRIALPEPLAETGWILSGDDLWSWDSDSQRAVHVSLADAGASHDSHDPDQHHGARPERPAATPDQLAQDLLDAVTPSTDVSVRSPRYVAGRAAYELALAPKSASSTIGEITMSVDADTGLPLDVAITPAGGPSPAFELGFTSVSFDTPPASTFEFSAPPGATVVEASDPAAVASPGVADRHLRHGSNVQAPRQDRQAPATAKPDIRTVGEAWETVVVVSGAQVPPELVRLVAGAQRVDNGGVGGRLVTTKIINAVLLDDGRILVGAVTPDALLAAATSAH